MRKRSRLQLPRDQEKRLAKQYGADQNIMSGAGIYRKNDVRNSDLSIEAKTTSFRQYVLKLDDLLKARKNALLDKREMAFIVDFSATGDSFAIVDEIFFRELIGGYLNGTTSEAP